jgi:hypothetical protein
VRYARLLVVGLLLTASACSEEQGRFPVVITSITDDGKPFPSLPVTLGRTPAGHTGADGRLRLRVVGKEGEKIAVGVTVPKGYKLAPNQPTSLVLRRLTDIEGGSGRPLPIEHIVKLSPLIRSYAVLVRVGVPGLPVQTFGTDQGVTNSKGVAIFLYHGTPGDELQVRLDTSRHPELRPQNPTVSFLLSQRSEAYVVRERFTVYHAPARHHRPAHHGPTRL